MLIDKNGKLFGKVSIIDILISIALIVCIIGIVVRFSANYGDKLYKKTEIKYTYKVSGVRQAGVDALLKKGKLFDNKTNNCMGEITDAKVEKASDYGVLADGRILNVTIPERYNVILTVELEGKYSTSAILTPDNDPIEAGSTVFLLTKWATTQGMITDVEIKE